MNDTFLFLETIFAIEEADEVEIPVAVYLHLLVDPLYWKNSKSSFTLYASLDVWSF